MKKTFIIGILLFSQQALSNTWLNDLECSSFIEQTECEKIYNATKNTDLSDYSKLTFDNQLKKITFLLNKKKDKIAAKKYDYFIKSLNQKLDEEQKKKINEQKDNIWTLLKNYSISEDYTPNPKYKINKG